MNLLSEASMTFQRISNLKPGVNKVYLPGRKWTVFCNVVEKYQLGYKITITNWVTDRVLLVYRIRHVSNIQRSS